MKNENEREKLLTLVNSHYTNGFLISNSH